VTVILTTHYIEEAEQMADRVGVINRGELILVEDKAELMRKLGKKQLTLQLAEPLAALPPGLEDWPLALGKGGTELTYTYDARTSGTGVVAVLQRLAAAGIVPTDLHTTESSLEDIFVSLVKEPHA